MHKYIILFDLHITLYNAQYKIQYHKSYINIKITLQFQD